MLKPQSLSAHVSCYSPYVLFSMVRWERHVFRMPSHAPLPFKGIYCVLYGACIWVLVRRKRQGDTWHIIYSSMLFLSVSAFLVLETVQTYGPLIKGPNGQSLSQVINIAAGLSWTLTIVRQFS
jgi:hypothetical protein